MGGEDYRVQIEQLHRQLEKASKIQVPTIEGSFTNILIVGMGGSALPGYVLQDYLQDCTIPVTVLSDYKVPAWVNESTLVFIISYSGETQETIAAYRIIVRRKSTVVAITSGGKIAQLAPMYRNELIKVQPGLQPRAAIGYLTVPIIKTLEQSDIIRGKMVEVETVIALLEKQSYEEYAKDVAEKIGDKTPIIYSSQNMAFISYRFKIALNENANTLAFANTYPEIFHNELNALHDCENYYFIIVSDDYEDQRLLEQLKAFKKILRGQTEHMLEVHLKGESRLGRIFSAVSLADWLSYHIALKKEIDPESIELIEKFKQS